ncbi:hypothetical protein RS030_101638 [Cryptosporidium xiaoi]|uniref:Uncharacterized protein n=1 Tax=Cryptosporidium xiaoi TaxID=659607 RepID=A0AAV9Y329_9CRYT
MKYRREDVIKQMSEIFNDIPEIIISDIFDIIVSENLVLNNKTDSKIRNNNSENLNNYLGDMIDVHNKLFDKLLEITNTENSVDNEIFINNNDNNIFDTANKYNMSYLDVCLQNKKSINNIILNKLENDLVIKLKKRPWDLIYIETNIINNEIEFLKNYLNKIFNSDKLYKIRENKNKLWPPDGPGIESKFIPIRIIDNSNINKNKIKEAVIKLRNELNITNDVISKLNIEYNKIINNTNIKEYKLIKSEELSNKLDKIKLKKKKIENDYYNEIFNLQNIDFINFILDSKSDNITFIDLHNYNRNEALSVTIFCITMILKFKLNVNFENSFLIYDNKEELINSDKLYVSQKNFKGNYVDLYICVGLGNYNYINNNIKPKLASLIRRLSYAFNLTWRFGVNGIIILRIQDNIDWYRYISRTLEIGQYL